MNQELSWLSSLAPDLMKVLGQRFLILRNIEQAGVIGRRSLAQLLGVTERVLRTDTDLLRQEDLITVTRSGMMLTQKGKQTVDGLSKMMDQLLGVQQLEKELARKLNIKRCLIVNGNLEHQPLAVNSMGKVLNNLLKTLLPPGKNIIAVMGGTTMAQVSNYLTSDLTSNRELNFVPARGGIGEQVDIQANNVSAQMAIASGGKHSPLYVPEHVSADTYRSLAHEPGVQEVIQLINQSNIVIHSIGDPILMAKRRSMSEQTIQMLKDEQAVVEAFGYFFNEAGKIVHQIPRIGLQLEKISTMDAVIVIAGGSSKAAAITAYLNNAPKNSQTYLITDEGAARTILRQ